MLDSLTRRTRPALLVTLAAALVAGLSAFTPATAPTPSSEATGDPALAVRLRAAVADLPGQGFAVATGDATTSASAAIGTADAGRPLTATTPQEIGSVTKSLTGLLYADAVQRGEVTPATTLGEVHGSSGPLPEELAVTTLHELATHTSGLPRLSTRAHVASFWTNLTYGNPYRWDTPASLLQDAGSTWLRTPRGEYSYSNLGFALLGNALAARADVPYPALLRERVLQPLGLTHTVAAPAQLPEGRARELGADGRAVTPWTSSGSTPAGIGVYSTAEDLGRLARAAATGELPGAAALQPGADGTGAGWFTATLGGRTFVGNNGATYGVQTSVWAEPGTGAWVAVTSPSGPGAGQDTEVVAFRLLGIEG